jgi:hypothetical protein
MLRGKLTHVLTNSIEPDNSNLYPGLSTLPSENTLPGEMLRWPGSGRVLGAHPELHYHLAWWFYERSVARVSVQATLDDAQSFLLGDNVLGPLA